VVYKKVASLANSFVFSQTNHAANEAATATRRDGRFDPAPGGHPYTRPERFRAGFFERSASHACDPGDWSGSDRAIAVGRPGGRVEVRPRQKDRGPFDVKAVTGDGKGKTFCYV
jgi:hypothetical protein